MDPKEPKEPGADVVSIEDARQKALGKDKDAPPAAAEPAVNVDANEFLKPVMAAIARELAGVADPDGTVRVGGSDEASRAKTAAVVKGLGMGLGQALAEAFGKWAQKIETGPAPGATLDVKLEPVAPPPDDKKPS
jgi:hypothetical protein